MTKEKIRQVSEKTGITTSLLGLYLKRKKRPSASQLEKIVAHGFSIRPFLFGKDHRDYIEELKEQVKEK